MAVLLGGRSSEHSISCISARSIVDALDPDRYSVSVVGIGRDGRWVRDADGGLGILSQDGPLPEVSAHAPAADIAASLDVDVVFPVLHGPWGEDGSIQGLLETVGVPYVGSGILSSAVSMDKGFMKGALAGSGLDVGRYVVATDKEWRTDPARVLARIEALGLPVFVKPARAGSSLGIVKVGHADGLRAAIESARKHDPRIIVEAAVLGAREIECGVLVDADGIPHASRCAEIIVNERHEFYDFEAKYLDDSATLVVPAQLPPEVEERVRGMAVTAFEALDCDGLARADFFVRADHSVVINEVNTMPGFTSISMYPRMWEATGVAYPDLVDRLVSDALRKGTGLH
ncbi:MAG: D-alanine--D-alanine ligase [Actinobacteria bacterium]|nr:D-alanine--D-alanine ligase [Actinomycetota bacterium]